MAQVSEVRLGAVRRLIEQVPDGTIRSLENVLASGGRGDRSIAMIHDMINAEMLERRLRSLVFDPIVPHCESNPTLVGRLSFPSNTLSLAWRGIKDMAPEMAETATRATVVAKAGDEMPPVYDAICLKVAEGLRREVVSFEPLRGALEATAPGLAERFAECMALTPLVRTIVPRLPVWVRTLSNEPAAAIRLAFRDATAVNEDAGPAFMEMLYGHLEEPWQVLRLISLVMDRPSDRYLASSELASFGQRLIDDIERRIDSVRRFDPDRGLEGGVDTAASLQQAVILMAEFEQWLAIKRDGPWGRKLAAHRRALALVAEARMREVEPAVNLALPLQQARFGARAVRGAPNLNKDIDAAAINRARALLGLVYETRSCASHGGFGSLRTKVVETLDPRIDQYAEDLLELLHAGEGDLERIRASLEVAAEFLGLVRDPSAAEIVRRRTAVA
jgi:hypothetical protein